VGLKSALEKAALSAARAFAGGAIVAFTSVSYMPDVAGSVALAIAVGVGGLTAVVKLIQLAIPKLSFASLIKNVTAAALADSFARAFLGSLAVFSLGVLTAPNLSLTQAALVAAITGAVTAGVRAAQGFFTSGEWPAKAFGG